jgi:small subunit ribosomal protein S20
MPTEVVWHARNACGSMGRRVPHRRRSRACPDADTTRIPRDLALAHSSRTWRGARTPQGKKRVRQSQARHAILQPRRAAAKTEVKDALQAAAAGDAEATATAVAIASSALDRAAKVGAIHPNAAARRKSRLIRKVGSVLGGQVHVTTGKVQRQVSKAAAAKAAKARIAAGKASKAKGEQTAAGKARAALSRSARAAKEAQSAPDAGEATAATASAPTRSSATKATATRSRSTTKSTGSVAKDSKKTPSKSKTGS